MKSLLLATLLLAVNIAFSQQSQTVGYSSTYVSDDTDYPFTYPTENRDTLYLADNAMGKMTYECWQMDETSSTVKKMPILVFKSPAYIEQRWKNDRRIKY